jgi:hypothetical protein
MQLKVEYFMLLGGLAAFLITLYWLRKRELREKYALGWLGISLLLLILGLFPAILMKTAHLLHFSYAALASFITAGFFFLFAFSVSISLSRQHRKNIKLTQEIGLLENRIRGLENQINSRGFAASEIRAPNPDHD